MLSTGIKWRSVLLASLDASRVSAVVQLCHQALYWPVRDVFRTIRSDTVHCSLSDETAKVQVGPLAAIFSVIYSKLGRKTLF